MSNKICEAQKLRDIITLEKGKPPAEQPYFGPDAELYLTPEYLRGRGTAEPVKASANAVRVSDGDTIVLWDGSNAGEFFRGRKGILASTMSHIQHGETFDVEYFFYAVKSWESHLKGQTSGSGIPHIDKEVFGKIEILRFGKPEQHQIATILSTIDTAIEQTEAIIAKQQRIKTGLTQDLLTRGIDEDGNIRSEETHEFKDSPLGRIPVGWKVVRLSSLTPSADSITYGVLKPGPFIEDGTPLLQIEDVIHGAIDVASLHRISPELDAQYKRTRLHGGELVVSLVGTVGRVAYIPQSLCGANLHRNLGLVQIIEPNSSKFTIHYLQSEIGQKEFSENALGSTQSLLNLSCLRSLRVIKPTPQEQTMIAERCDSIDSIISGNKLSLKKLRSIKTALMQDLLTGRKRVTALLKDTEEITS
jgi:type I restriction enzyme S subunit